MPQFRVINIPAASLGLNLADTTTGDEVIAAILKMASTVLRELVSDTAATGRNRCAAVGRLRGTGRGVRFGRFVEQLERDLPIRLESPFEGSSLVAGGVWAGNRVVGPQCSSALAKLRWSAHADDLPMHVHQHSDRFIIVHEGRGFFHVSAQSIDEFNGTDVRTIPARERDVFVFTRGVVHTFSTLDEPMTLLSCQLPYIPFESKDQYGLPVKRWIARDNPEPVIPRVACDPAWSVLIDN